MSTRLFFSLFLFLSYSDLISQSFENISLINNNIVPYSLNEANAYLSTDGNTLYFNSSNNSNNIGGLADMNDVWYRNKNNNVWGSPINLSVVNTSDNLGTLSQFILNFSEDMPIFYGLTSVLLAVVLGVGAAMIRRIYSNWNNARLAKLKK